MISSNDPSPSDWFTAFLSVASECKAAFLERSHDARDYTDFMLREVMPKIAHKLGVCCHERDYYTIDCIFYHEKDGIHFDAVKQTYAKYISVAIEHENNYLGTAAEMNRLQLFNAPLKVLITYPTKKKEQQALDKYALIVQGADVFGDVSTLRRQLVIFGDDTRTHWTAFVYQDSKFIPLEPQAKSAVS